MRHLFATLFVLAIALCGPSTALGQSADPVDQVIEQLEAQGFEIQSTRRTFLGRVRVLSTKDNREREVVFNPRNGNVLRDFTREIDSEAWGDTRQDGEEDFDREDEDDDAEANDTDDDEGDDEDDDEDEDDDDDDEDDDEGDEGDDA